MESFQEQAVAYLKGEMGSAERAAFEENLGRSEDVRVELARSRELLEMLEVASEKATAERVQRQIREAMGRGATDIHLAPQAREVLVRNRVNGVLQEVERYPRDLHAGVLDRWKILAGVSVTEKSGPQDGRILYSDGPRERDLRVHFTPTFHGELVTARVVEPEMVRISLDRLSFFPDHLEAVQRLAALPHGLVICSGPMSSGKGTVLYSMLQGMDLTARNVMTIEDPVEFLLPGVSQLQIQRKAGFGFAEALRAALHSDPDVVMVSEVRDLETAEMAVEAALCGHLVTTTLHATSAVMSISRLVEIGVSPFLIAQSLAGIIGQRLVRKVCQECVEEYRPSAEALTSIGLAAEDEGPFRKGKGCPACQGTGYRGRVALYEILEASQEVRSLIGQGAGASTLWEQTFGRNGGSLREDAIRKVRQGLTTAELVADALMDYPHPPPSASSR